MKKSILMILIMATLFLVGCESTPTVGPAYKPSYASYSVESKGYEMYSNSYYSNFTFVYPDTWEVVSDETKDGQNIIILKPVKRESENNKVINIRVASFKDDPSKSVNVQNNDSLNEWTSYFTKEFGYKILTAQYAYVDNIPAAGLGFIANNLSKIFLFFQKDDHAFMLQYEESGGYSEQYSQDFTSIRNSFKVN